MEVSLSVLSAGRPLPAGDPWHLFVLKPESIPGLYCGWKDSGSIWNLVCVVVKVSALLARSIGFCTKSG
jgi:hypothetical protein